MHGGQEFDDERGLADGQRMQGIGKDARLGQVFQHQQVATGPPVERRAIGQWDAGKLGASRL